MAKLNLEKMSTGNMREQAETVNQKQERLKKEEKK
jgi:hypothetical protein